MLVVMRIAFPQSVWFFLSRVLKESNLGVSEVVVKAVMQSLGMKDTHGSWRWEADYPPIRAKILEELADQVGAEETPVIKLSETTRAAKHPEGGWFGICDRCGWSGKKLPTIEGVVEELKNHDCKEA